METSSGALPFAPPHPGEYLREDILPALGINATQLAAHLGVSKQTIFGILAEKRAVSTDMAIRLGQAFRNGARFWLALQMQHDLWISERKGKPAVKPLDWEGGIAA
ncbi:MAG: HigA family addiction module antidote protein [Rhodobacter sp.]|nr:HigA family addiction module antidote protein [Rhodobacter sp.]